MYRVLRDDPSKSDMHNRQGMTVKMIWHTLCDWRMWPLYILGMTHMSMLLNTEVLFETHMNFFLGDSPGWAPSHLSNPLPP